MDKQPIHEQIYTRTRFSYSKRGLISLQTVSRPRHSHRHGELVVSGYIWDDIEDVDGATTVGGIGDVGTSVGPALIPKLDLIVTPERPIETGGGPRPSGIDWEILDDQTIATIPILQPLQ